MKKADIVVIGGSAAGLTAAITARRHFPEKSTLMIRKEKQVMIPCGIPYIFGTLGSTDKNLISDTALEKERVELLVAEVTNLDRQSKVLRAGAEEISYDRLIIATGSLPTLPPIAGADLEGVYPIFKDCEYLRKLQAKLAEARDVVVIGCGFIGIEFGDEIRKMGEKNITVVEVAPHCLTLAYDNEFCVEAEEVLKARGIQVKSQAKIVGIAGEPGNLQVKFMDQSSLRADLVILGIGSVANIGLAKAAGLSIGTGGAIEVDRTMRTSDPNIFACGDCAEKTTFFGGRPSALKLASIATLEARIAGANLFGIKRENPGTVGVWCTALGDFALGTAGLTESMARQLGYDVIASTVEGTNRHPASMPGGAKIRLKLIFESSSGVLLGGQVRGDGSAGEIINEVAACVQKRMTAEDIATFQMGTHPALTASPIAYALVNAAELAIAERKKR